MTNRLIYEVWFNHSDGKAFYYAAKATEEEAIAKMNDFIEHQAGRGITMQNPRVTPKEVTTDFVLPEKLLTSSGGPRELFYTTVDVWVVAPDKPNAWKGLEVRVHKRGFEGAPDEHVATYKRNYPSMYRTFEPFRQGDKFYALVSADYGGTDVLDLQTGEIIAREERTTYGFCPTGFYVPDYYDIHEPDGDHLIGSHYWDHWDEVPDGSYGFVWGCIWGDDSVAWKVQYLDLTDITKDEIRRDERFGYLYLDTTSKDPRDFISIYEDDVTFSVPITFNVKTGQKLSMYGIGCDPKDEDDAQGNPKV